MLDDLLRRNGMQLEPLDSDSDAEADLALPPEAVELPSKVPESSSLRLLGQPKLSAGCLVVSCMLQYS